MSDDSTKDGPDGSGTASGATRAPLRLFLAEGEGPALDREWLLAELNANPDRFLHLEEFWPVAALAIGPAVRVGMGSIVIELQGTAIQRPEGEVLRPDADFFKTLESKSARFGSASVADGVFVLPVEIDGAPAYRLCCEAILLIPGREEGP